MKAIITVGLGFGDEGKGATTDYLCRKHNAKLVVRYSGGCQAGHNVQLASGHRHCFSQFGAGTFAGARTYLAQPMIIDPLALYNEAKALKAYGVIDPYERLTIHRRCLVSTPIHKMVNQADVDNIKHGSCGMGIGATRKYHIDYGNDALFACNLISLGIVQQKLEMMWNRLIDKKAGNVIENMAYDLVSNSRGLNIDEPSWPSCLRGLEKLYGDSQETIVFEGAQGLLIDEAIGRNPHTTWSDVTPKYALDLCKEWQIEDVETLGITRAYMTRHGNGPLPTERRLLKYSDPGNPPHQFQGTMRFGRLDLPLLKYAATHIKLDGLVVNHLDQLGPENNVGTEWVCTKLRDEVWKSVPDEKPDCEPLSIPGVLDALSEIAPIKLLGYGPTAGDRREVVISGHRTPSSEKQ